MPAAPLVAKKLKAGSSSTAIGMELDRRAHVYANEIDPSRTPDNLYWVGGEWVAGRDGATPEPLDEAIERRMGELNTKRKIRTDAVKAEGFVLSSNAQLDESTAVEFLKEGVDWMAERYGRENVLAAAIHLDEDTPHAQFWIAPVIHDPETGYDRLSAKELFTPNKVDRKAKKVIEEGTLTKLQRDFYREVSSRYGYSEPFTADQRMANGKVYKSQAAYKADRAVQKKRKELEDVREEIKRENERLEGLRQAREGAVRRVETLERIAADCAAVSDAPDARKAGLLGTLVGRCVEFVNRIADLLPDGLLAAIRGGFGNDAAGAGLMTVREERAAPAQGRDSEEIDRQIQPKRRYRVPGN